MKSHYQTLKSVTHSLEDVHTDWANRPSAMGQWYGTQQTQSHGVFSLSQRCVSFSHASSSSVLCLQHLTRWFVDGQATCQTRVEWDSNVVAWSTNQMVQCKMSDMLICKQMRRALHIYRGGFSGRQIIIAAIHSIWVIDICFQLTYLFFISMFLGIWCSSAMKAWMTDVRCDISYSTNITSKWAIESLWTNDHYEFWILYELTRLRLKVVSPSFCSYYLKSNNASVNGCL